MLLFIYIHCEELEQDFKFYRTGAYKVTLKQMREFTLSNRVTMFSHIIQSAKDVVLIYHTLIIFMYS